jgi:D-alanyl-D-alanine carboxypeptidase
MMQWVRKGTPFSLGTYAPPEADLVDVGDGHLLRSKAADAFRRLQAAAAAAGHTIVAVSGYRSHERQVRTHETWVQRRLAKARGAISREKAEREVGEFSARAGHSEHQLGTTVDVSVPEQNPFNHDGGPSAFATSCAG